VVSGGVYNTSGGGGKLRGLIRENTNQKKAAEG